MHSSTPPHPETDDWEDGIVSANGVDLHYYRTGNAEGNPLVLAHGLYDDARCFAPTATVFADRFDVIMFDARGHGLSDAPETGYGVEDRVADLADLLDELDVNSPILWGHSMGGNTVASLAASRPSLPRALVLEDPAGMLRGIHERPTDEHAREVRELVESWHVQSHEKLLSSFEHEGWSEYLADARRRVRPEITEIVREGYRRPAEVFPDISRPTLVLRANADTDERVRDRESVALLDDGRLEHVADAGHCIRRDEFEKTVQLVRRFLTGSTEEPNA